MNSAEEILHATHDWHALRIPFTKIRIRNEQTKLNFDIEVFSFFKTLFLGFFLLGSLTLAHLGDHQIIYNRMLEEFWTSKVRRKTANTWAIHFVDRVI